MVHIATSSRTTAALKTYLSEFMQSYHLLPFNEIKYCASSLTSSFQGLSWNGLGIVDPRQLTRPAPTMTTPAGLQTSTPPKSSHLCPLLTWTTPYPNAWDTISSSTWMLPGPTRKRRILRRLPLWGLWCLIHHQEFTLTSLPVTITVVWWVRLYFSVKVNRA